MLTELISLRKKQLQKEMNEAIDLGEQDYVLFLESQWVHRYGIETLKDSHDYDVEPRASMALEEIATSNEDDEFEIVGQQTLFPEQNEDYDLVDEVPLNIPKEINEDNECFEDPISKEPKCTLDKESKLNFSDCATVAVAPPPTPAIKHLRKWLPSIAEKLPKAS